MGTHCYIAEEKDNDMYRSIYCHLDGYPEEVGKLLVKYYDTTEKLRELLALGDVYCLQKKLNPDPSALHCFGALKLLEEAQRGNEDPDTLINGLLQAATEFYDADSHILSKRIGRQALA